ncbi:hypothetical protein [Saccharopolyspora kobensis]|uniref:hypothetical protein n=1 Tax=Saccharopolyspora kobensis TaxID=146035 RepID=UPI00332ED368
MADLEARGVTVTPSEAPIVATFLDVASEMVRTAAGAPISQLTTTVELEGEPGQRLHLPGRPIRSVATVALDGAPVTDWRLASGSLWRREGWQTGCGPSVVKVTYTHGLPSVPADIVDLVCRLASRALVSYRDSDGAEALAARVTVSERIGDWSAGYAYGDHFSEVEIPEYLRDRLSARFGGSAHVVRSR